MVQSIDSVFMTYSLKHIEVMLILLFEGKGDGK